MKRKILETFSMEEAFRALNYNLTVKTKTSRSQKSITESFLYNRNDLYWAEKVIEWDHSKDGDVIQYLLIKYVNNDDYGPYNVPVKCEYSSWSDPDFIYKQLISHTKLTLPLKLKEWDEYEEEWGDDYKERSDELEKILETFAKDLRRAYDAWKESQESVKRCKLAMADDELGLAKDWYEDSLQSGEDDWPYMGLGNDPDYLERVLSWWEEERYKYFEEEEEETFEEAFRALNRADKRHLNESRKSLKESYSVKFGLHEKGEEKFADLDSALKYINGQLDKYEHPHLVLYNDGKEMIWLTRYRDENNEDVGFTVGRQNDKSLEFDKKKGGLFVKEVDIDDPMIRSSFCKTMQQMGYIKEWSYFGRNMKFAEVKDKPSYIDFKNNVVYYNKDEQIQKSIEKIISEYHANKSDQANSVQNSAIKENVELKDVEDPNLASGDYISIKYKGKEYPAKVISKTNDSVEYEISGYGFYKNGIKLIPGSKQYKIFNIAKDLTEAVRNVDHNKLTDELEVFFNTKGINTVVEKDNKSSMFYYLDRFKNEQALLYSMIVIGVEEGTEEYEPLELADSYPTIYVYEKADNQKDNLPDTIYQVVICSGDAYNTSSKREAIEYAMSWLKDKGYHILSEDVEESESNDKYYLVIANELAFDLEFYASLVNRSELISEISRYIDLDRFDTSADILMELQEAEFEKAIEDLCMAAAGEAYLEDVGILIKNKAGKVISGIDFTLSLIDELQDYEADNDIIQKLRNQQPFNFTYERDINDYGDFVDEGIEK